MLQVKDLMTSEVITLDPDDDLALAERLMQESRIRHMPVVDDEFRLVGLISQRDLLRASLSTLQMDGDSDRELKASVPIARIMRPHVDTIGPDEPLKVVVDRMRSKKYGCMPVVDADGVLVGIVTDTDFLRFSSMVLGTLTGPDHTQRLLEAIREQGGARSGEA